MKSYVGHAFHAEVAGENVWSVKINAKPRQFYNIDRSQQAICTQDLLEVSQNPPRRLSAQQLSRCPPLSFA